MQKCAYPARTFVHRRYAANEGLHSCHVENAKPGMLAHNAPTHRAEQLGKHYSHGNEHHEYKPAQNEASDQFSPKGCLKAPT